MPDQDNRAATVALTEYAGLALPERPRLIPWLLVVELGDGRLQLRSDEAAHTLANQLLVEIFRAIRAGLDGRHTVREIIGMAGTDTLPTTVVFLLQLLHGKGLLQQGLGTGALDEGEQMRWRSQLRFLDHFVPDASSAHVALTNAQVGVVGPAALCEAVSSSLRSVGIGHISELADPRTWIMDSQRIGRLQGFDLVIACENSPAFSRFEAVNRVCLASRARWLCVSVSGKTARLGPTFVPHQTACHTCLTLRLKTHQPDLEGYERYRLQVDAADGGVDEGSVGPLCATIAAQAALEAMRLLTGFSPAVTIGRFHEFTALSPAAAPHEVLRVPRCPSCGRQRTLAQAWDRELADVAS